MDADQGWLRALEMDLDALAHAESDLDRDAEVAERIRIERAAMSLFDRIGGRADIQTRLGRRISGSVVDGAQDWLVIESAPETLALIPKHSVVWIRGDRSDVRQSGVLHSRSVSSVYRQWARDRAEVRIQLVDRSEITGRLSAAYADHIEVITFERGAYAIAFTAIDLAIRGTD